MQLNRFYLYQEIFRVHGYWTKDVCKCEIPGANL